jgi:hypothetical protein
LKVQLAAVARFVSLRLKVRSLELHQCPQLALRRQ